MDQNIPARRAAVHTITRAPAKSMKSETETTAIQPSTGEPCTDATRFVPRQAAQCQIPSHCVAHSWQSIFAHDMQRANAGRCSCTEQRCVVGGIGTREFNKRCPLTSRAPVPTLTRHMTATASRFSFYYASYR